MKTGKIFAPFSIQQLKGLQDWQDCDWVHPFTCCSHVPMKVKTEGFICSECNNIQTWAFDFMSDGAPPNPLA